MDPITRRKAKIVLAGLAVLGVGAAATSALWTDDVFFSGDVTVATFNLQGSTDAGTTWEESDTFVTPDTSTITLTFPALTDLSPGDTQTWTGSVRNDPTSTVSGDASAISVDESLLPAALAADLDVTVAYTTPADALDLAPGDVAPFTVTVALAADADPALMGTTGTVVIEVNGVQLATP
jgi:predicted ribosomally synthesized peptide with SipW-like signal peptide